MLPRSNIQREGEFSKIPQHVWFKARRIFCEVCTVRYGTIEVCKGGFLSASQCIDHIFPRRFLEARKLEPHLEVNLLSACRGCHGKKLRVETSLFAGDSYAFIQGLRRIGYPIERVMAASRFYGLWEFEKFYPLDKAPTLK